MIILREYQQAVDAFLMVLETNIGNNLCPEGSGKSAIMAAIIRTMQENFPCKDSRRHPCL